MNLTELDTLRKLISTIGKFYNSAMTEAVNLEHDRGTFSRYVKAAQHLESAITHLQAAHTEGVCAAWGSKVSFGEWALGARPEKTTNKITTLPSGEPASQHSTSSAETA